MWQCLLLLLCEGRAYQQFRLLPGGRANHAHREFAVWKWAVGDSVRWVHSLAMHLHHWSAGFGASGGLCSSDAWKSTCTGLSSYPTSLPQEARGGVVRLFVSPMTPRKKKPHCSHMNLSLHSCFPLIKQNYGDIFTRCYTVKRFAFLNLFMSMSFLTPCDMQHKKPVVKIQTKNVLHLHYKSVLTFRYYTPVLAFKM